MSHEHNPEQYYTVWKLRFNLATPDPDTTSTRYHTTIFVETSPSKSGVLYHVVGDITSGMSYQKKSSDKPEDSKSFHSREFLGYTDATTHPKQWDMVLSSVPPPKKQKALNTKTAETEQVKTWDPLTFYKPGENRRPLFKCTEWTEQRAIPALEEAGLILSVFETSGSSASYLARPYSTTNRRSQTGASGSGS
ncbi:hypothetical protein GQX73_g4095 [Xylaria multiplex]|uniref:Uncharacterized protein n=1 Tax=Xylaria multiplex TaxID=323545 RepID=A0A7C8N8V3_9PEZI|nr:hypothetical protein GQX73_g4095 [Xylaria multiplex]